MSSTTTSTPKHSHRCAANEDLTLYHAYDVPNDPQYPDKRLSLDVPYIKGRGITCPKQPKISVTAQDLITEENILQHYHLFRTANSTQPHFIPMYDDTARVVKSAEEQTANSGRL